MGGMLSRRTLFVGLMAGLVAASFAAMPAAAEKTQAETRTETRAFAPGGSLHLTMRTGDVRILKGDTNQIRVRYTSESERSDFADRVTLRFDVRGKDATIDFHMPSHGDVAVEVEVPAQTDLRVNLTVGDVTVRGVEGNKDLEVHVGDIEVEPITQTGYRRLEASTHVGGITTAEYVRVRGWIGNSVKSDGTGTYRVHVHTRIGDITFD
jgi:hypothetical protein